MISTFSHPIVDSSRVTLSYPRTHMSSTTAEDDPTRSLELTSLDAESLFSALTAVDHVRYPISSHPHIPPSIPPFTLTPPKPPLVPSVLGISTQAPARSAPSDSHILGHTQPPALHQTHPHPPHRPNLHRRPRSSRYSRSTQCRAIPNPSRCGFSIP